jgi:hypothetical protein
MGQFMCDNGLIGPDSIDLIILVVYPGSQSAMRRSALRLLALCPWIINGLPYLELHSVQQLAEGRLDTVASAVTLSCWHREIQMAFRSNRPCFLAFWQA